MSDNEFEANLNTIKAHPLFPFTTHREDALQYLQLELYWLSLFKCVVGANADAAWKAWHPPDPQREGNPVFSALNQKDGRALRVIHAQPNEREKHYRNGGDYLPFIAFLSRYEGDPYNPSGDTGAIAELVFSSDLSEESEGLARIFIRRFCVDRLSLDEMEEMIAIHAREIETSRGSGESDEQP